MHNGYIKLWRKVCSNGLVQDHKTFTLWIYLLCKATHKPIDMVLEGKKVHLEPGQIITGRKALARTLRMSERNIRTCLKRLRNIENVTIKATNKFSIISIINWDRYQSQESINDQQSDQQVTSKRPASDHKQECKEYKNIINKSDFDLFWKQYPIKKSKSKAHDIWEKLRKHGKLPPIDTILTAIANQKEEKQILCDSGVFCPEWKHPTTWLNQGCWEDESVDVKKEAPKQINLDEEAQRQYSELKNLMKEFGK
jgi:hypothetical protein